MAGNIVLIGFSGTGKSTVGRRLAQRLGWPFADLDDMLVEQFGKTIERVFAEEGEECFRSAERELVASSCSRTGVVVALGGGAVTCPVNRRAVTDGNWVVRLDASPETILVRLRGDGDEVRPLLSSDDPLSRIRYLKQARADCYEIASYTVKTDDLGVDEVVDSILTQIGIRCR